tara:strand:- start:228 stop:521 length:294 start_codon:yes stop_codon:yes gene_type:complete
MLRNKIENIIYEVLNEMDTSKKITKSNSTILFGKNGLLDSLDLVNLLVTIEQNIEDEFNIALIIADERAMSHKRSPFRTIMSLIDYVTMLVEEDKND